MSIFNPELSPHEPLGKIQLPGGVVVWVVFALEMGTFALFFLGFAWLQHSESDLFKAGQQLLHPGWGTLNTLILLSGSWMVARAVEAARMRQAVTPWLNATALCGLVFMGIKTLGYTQIFAKGISLSTNAFWFYYLFLTLLHNLHVALGVYFLLYLAWQYRKQNTLTVEQQQTLESCAIYWHLVDLIWVFLFPLIYFSEVW